MPPTHPLAQLTQVSGDLRYALRGFRRSPGFTAAIVLTLALGIGANAVIFGIADPVLLRPLPYPEPARLVTVGEVMANSRGLGGFSARGLLDWRVGNDAFESLSGWANRGFNLSSPSQIPERVDGMIVTWDFFRTLGVAPALGRPWLIEEDRPAAPRTAILSYALWQRRFAGNPRVVGQSITVDGAPCTVIGVMPRGFRFFYGPEMWMPMRLDPAAADRRVSYISAVARLKPGSSVRQAEAQSTAFAKALDARHGARVRPLGDAYVVQKEKDRLLVLMGAVGLVLLIACANVANLLLARATARHGEMAVRVALGAGRARLVAQLLTESLLLALAGGLAGLLLANWAARLGSALVSATLLAGRSEVALDLRVVAFTFALSVLTGIVFGGAPAWRSSHIDLEAALKAGRSRSGGLRQGRLRGALAAAEVALSLVLLVCAGLTIRSLRAIQGVDLGFRRDHLLTVGLAMSPQRYAAPDRTRTFYLQVLERAASLPGVRAASVAMGQAPWDTPEATMFDLPGQPPPAPGQIRGAALERVTPGYFRAFAIGIAAGRDFTARDDETAPPVAVVNRTFVAMYLPHDRPLGQRVLLNQRSWEIVGVAGDVKFGGPEANPVPMLYLPMMQSPAPGGSLALLTSADPLSLAPTLRAALAQLDPDTPASRLKTMDRIALDSMAQPRVETGLFAGFAAVALLLAGLGVYGVVGFAVAQETHDIGVRMALGAGRRHILKLVLRRGLTLSGVGLLAGVGAALALTRVLSTLLFRVKPTDTATFVCVSLVLLFVAMAASFLPAHRATRIDPAAALRAE